MKDSWLFSRYALMILSLLAIASGPICAETSLCGACVVKYGPCAPFCCTDDYCSKPFPCVECWSRFCPDNYCAKPLPCSCFTTRYCPYQYCQKPLPLPCGPVPAKWYKCRTLQTLPAATTPHESTSGARPM